MSQGAHGGVDAPVALGTVGSEDGCATLLLMIAANSADLRTSIERNTRAPPTKSEGGAMDKSKLDEATCADVVRPADYTANGIVCLSNWPSSTDGTGPAAGRAGNVQRKWDTDTNRNMVINMRSTLVEAYEVVKGRSSSFKIFHTAFDKAQDSVKDLMKTAGKTASDKVIPRTVLYLFQKLATVLW